MGDLFTNLRVHAGGALILGRHVQQQRNWGAPFPLSTTNPGTQTPTGISVVQILIT